MGIESTVDITRESAISRIKKISSLFNEKNYLAISEQGFEPDYIDMQRFVDAFKGVDVENINQWTDRMLESRMDCPFFRYSMFENYLIK